MTIHRNMGVPVHASNIFNDRSFGDPTENMNRIRGLLRTESVITLHFRGIEIENILNDMCKKFKQDEIEIR